MLTRSDCQPGMLCCVGSAAGQHPAHSAASPIHCELSDELQPHTAADPLPCNSGSEQWLPGWWAASWLTAAGELQPGGRSASGDKIERSHQGRYSALHPGRETRVWAGSFRGNPGWSWLVGKCHSSGPLPVDRGCLVCRWESLPGSSTSFPAIWEHPVDSGWSRPSPHQELETESLML